MFILKKYERNEILGQLSAKDAILVNFTNKINFILINYTKMAVSVP